MKYDRFFKAGVILLTILVIVGCEQYLEIDNPSDQLIGNEIFENEDTVNAAFASIYTQLRDNSFASGLLSGISYELGLYTDELDLYSNDLSEYEGFYNNNLDPNNSAVSNLWSTGYNIIYSANRIIEGVNTSNNLSQEEKNQFLAEAYFIRAYVHFNLLNLFGDIPYIISTDYEVNKKIARQTEDEAYQLILKDLLLAKTLFPRELDMNQNLRPNYWVAAATLARGHLYHKDWQQASDLAREVIEDGGYSLLNDLSQVFLQESDETIWQLGNNSESDDAYQSNTFVFVAGPPPNAALTESFLMAQEPGDERLDDWIGSVTDGDDTWYYSYKYKLNIGMGEMPQYSVLIRLAEMYLIVAECQAKLGNYDLALEYLNPIRARAGLEPIISNSGEEILEAVLKERRSEFFTEQGHRFFDLRRFGLINQTLSELKPNWDATDSLLPIPETELILNPNLLPQNDGY